VAATKAAAGESGLDVPGVVLREEPKVYLAAIDLPRNFHPKAIRALAGFTPWGAGGATCDRRSWSGLRSRSRVVERLAA
jgi:hypothetical protein